jgi:hypothetical protein
MNRKLSYIPTSLANLGSAGRSARFCNQRKRSGRSGVATLEFVLGIPFLMLVMAIVFTVAYSGVNQTKTVFQARHQVWKMRESGNSHNLADYKRVSDTKPMYLLAPLGQNNMPGEVSGAGQATWSTYSWLLGGSVSTKSKTVIITGTWDHKEITNFNSNGPHFSVLGRIGNIQNLGILETLDTLISFAL